MQQAQRFLLQLLLQSLPTMPQLIHATTGAVIAKHLELAHNPITRLKGLMFRSGLPEGHGLWIKPCNSIHSCFMKFEFDAVFLDNDYNVLHCEHAMKPWRASPMIWKAKSIIELAAGTLKNHDIEAGTELSIK